MITFTNDNQAIQVSFIVDVPEKNRAMRRMVGATDADEFVAKQNRHNLQILQEIIESLIRESRK